MRAAGGIDPLPSDPPSSLSRQPWAIAVLWIWTLGRLELLMGASWGPGSPFHAVPPEPEVVSIQWSDLGKQRLWQSDHSGSRLLRLRGPISPAHPHPPALPHSQALHFQVPSFPCCVTLDQSLSLSEPLFLPLSSSDNNGTCLSRLVLRIQ